MCETGIILPVTRVLIRGIKMDDTQNTKGLARCLTTTVVPLRLLLAWASPVHLLRNLSINTSIIERFSSPSVLVGFILKFYFSLFLIMFDHVWIPLIHQQRILLIIGHSEAAPRYKNPQTTEQSFHGAAENVLAHIAQPRVTGCMLVNSCAFTQDTIFY